MQLKALVPINSFVGKKIGQYMREVMMAKDKRLKVVSEMLSSMKIVKLYVWEGFFKNWISEVRRAELDKIWQKAKIGVMMSIRKWLIYFHSETHTHPTFFRLQNSWKKAFGFFRFYFDFNSCKKDKKKSNSKIIHPL